MKNNLTAYKSDDKQKGSNSIFRFKSDRLIFFICVIIAAVFWLLIKLSAVYTVENSFKISYKNEPSGLRVTNIIDSTLDLNLSARGFLILKLNLFNDMDNLEINLDNYSIEQKGDNKYAIYTQELTNKLAQIVGISEKNIQISKAMLSFDMEKTGQKIVPVIPDYELGFVSQYDLYNDVTSNPEVVTVYGPQIILDSILGIRTTKLVRENVMSDFDVDIELENPYPDLLRFSSNEVSLKLEVEKFTESEMQVPINQSNLQYEIKTFPTKVKVFYRVAQIDFNKVRAHQFNIYPVINNLDILKANKLPLKLSKYPDFVRNVRIVPPTVEFLIIK